MAVREKFIGSIVLLGSAGLAMSLFGNVQPKPNGNSQPEKTPKVVVSTPTSRRVTLRAEHKDAHSTMIVEWTFGEGGPTGSQPIDRFTSAYENAQIVPIGRVVSITAQPGKDWKTPETTKVQIYFDDVPQCPDHWIGRGQKTYCTRTVK